jgi:SAM-dependent methyltransferase
MYDTLWADWYYPAAAPALETLFFSRVPPTSSVLDVCCGSGHVTEQLVQRGYEVTGVDIASELISIARGRIPSATFLIQDIRELAVRQQFDSALSTFDSLNHILTVEELEAAFRSIRAALRPGALFVFDMNLEEAFLTDLREWHTTVAPHDVTLVRGEYDLESHMAYTQLIWFQQTGQGNLWERQISTVYERAYTQDEISTALRNAGFTNFSVVPAADAGVTSALGFGRMFFSVLV